MANISKSKKGLLSRIADGSRLASDILLGGTSSLSSQGVKQAAQAAIQQVERLPSFDADYVGIEMLLGSSEKPVRTRTQIYTKLHFMAQDGLISTAMRQHVQMALGGHETTGETIFIESKPDAKQAEEKLVKEFAIIAKQLNKVAHSICFNAACFGDAYARIYTEPKKGVVALDTDNVFPPLVQPYELLGTTIGYVVSEGQKLQTRIDHLRIARMKMPRMVLLPQMKVIENAQKINLEADRVEHMVPLPSLAGGSFLDAAEQDFDNLYAALRGLVGQRIAGSIDETLITANMGDMTRDQMDRFKTNIEKMLSAMKQRAEDQVRSGVYSTSRNFHVIPVFNEKQLTQISSFQGASASGTGTNIEDVLFLAKKLGGTLGIDIAMLGFADQLSGGLGEGGFARTSSQAAERSRIIRTAFTQFANDLIDRHMLAKYGYCWADEERPYSINFYGSIAALEAEKQASQERAMNKSAILVQVLAQMRDLGIGTEAMEHLMANQMQLDQDAAKLYAQAIKNAKPPVPPDGAGGYGGDQEVPGPDDGADELNNPPGGVQNGNEQEEVSNG